METYISTNTDKINKIILIIHMKRRNHYEEASIYRSISSNRHTF